jgi:hypothetical protein
MEKYSGSSSSADRNTTMKKLLIFCLLLVLYAGSTFAQDSIYIYRNGAIIYRSQADQVDSLAFHPTNYWSEQRSAVVFDKLKATPTLSTFAKMLELTGYDKKLDNMTVWAPNNDALKTVDLNDLPLLRTLVENHLSEGNYWDYTTTFPFSAVIMLNNKHLALTKSDGAYYLDGRRISTIGIKLAAGRFHILEGYIPFRPTLLDYINQDGTTDSLSTFLRSMNKKVYDATLKDSVLTNDYLTSLGASLNDETKDYTLLVPDNQTWSNTVADLMGLYPASTDPAVLASRLKNVQKLIVKDLIIKGRQIDSLKSVLTTTLGEVYNHPTEQFGLAALDTTLSNGNILKIGKLKLFKAPTDTIRVEAENPLNRSSFYAQLVLKTYESRPETHVSDNAYLDAVPTSTSNLQPPRVIFSMPNVHPGKYNLYVVFVPTYLEDTTQTKPYSVKFYLDYPNIDGTTVTTYASTTNSVTDPKNCTKVLVKSDLSIGLFNMELIQTKLPRIKVTVQNAATSTQTSYSREIRTDCILLEPVQQPAQ